MRWQPIRKRKGRKKRITLHFVLRTPTEASSTASSCAASRRPWTCTWASSGRYLPTGPARLSATLVKGTQARSKASMGHMVKEKETMLLQARQHYEPRILCKSAGTLSTFAIYEFGKMWLCSLRRKNAPLFKFTKNFGVFSILLGQPFTSPWNF